MVNILLSSTVIGVIITGAYSFIHFQKANSLKYITEERKKWREEIRKIMEEIEKSEEKTISRVLVQLKARINAYGIYSEMDYTKDAHIWRLIEELEKQGIESNRNKSCLEETNEKQKEHDENKNLLLKFLSLLLKNDWDRSKYEIEGHKQLLFNNFLYIAAFILYVIMISINADSFFKINNIPLIVILVGYGLVLAAMNYGPTSLRNKLTKEQQKSTKNVAVFSNKTTSFVFKLTRKEQKKIIRIYKVICVCILCIVIFGVGTYVLKNEKFDLSYLSFILINILLIPSTWACYNIEIEAFHRKQNYFFTIDQLLTNNTKIKKAKLDTFPEK